MSSTCPILYYQVTPKWLKFHSIEIININQYFYFYWLINCKWIQWRYHSISDFSSYIYTNEDCFDHNKALDSIFEISETKLTITNKEGSSWDNHSIFGKQVISSDSNDIFRWAFNIRCDELIIGICSIKNNQIDKDFTKSNTKSSDIDRGKNLSNGLVKSQKFGVFLLS